MIKLSDAWEGWDSRINFDLFSQESELHTAFADSLAIDAVAIEKLLQRCSSVQPGCTAARVTEDLHAELISLSEKNKELRATLEATTARLQRSKQTYQDLVQDQKMLCQEVKDTHEAYLMAKKYYKKNLRIYYTVESTHEEEEIILIQFFTERRNVDSTYTVKLKRNTKTGRNELMEMEPMLATFKAIKTRLAETNDTAGALCCIRQSFLTIRQKK